MDEESGKKIEKGDQLLADLARYLHDYEAQFGHSVPASVLRSRLFSAGFEAREWLERGTPNPEWAARAEFLDSEEGKAAKF
ncbi:MAG: hypothetical protein FJY62_04635 [Betaproteobacteria bacterium]|nr:hypothetical protein [Betaproteobacteria bacterium]